MFANAARGQVHGLINGPLDCGFIHLPCAMQIGIDRQGAGDADGIGQLDRAALSHAGCDHILGQIPGGIGGGAVDFCWVFAAERAATMRGGPAVGVDDDLAPGQAGVAVRAADHKGAGRVDPPFGRGRNPAFGQHFADVGLDDGADIGAGLAFQRMLGGQHDGCHLDRLATGITQRNLAFRIRAQGRFLPGFAHLGQTAQDGVGILDRGGHQFRGFAGGVSEHDALIAGPFVFAFLGINAHRDMGGLLVQQVGDFTGGVVKLVLLVPDILDRGAGNAVNRCHHLRQLGRVRQADLATNHHAVGGGKGFACDAGLGLDGQERVQHGVGNPVTQFIGVSFGNGFRGENIVRTCHGVCSS